MDNLKTAVSLDTNWSIELSNNIVIYRLNLLFVLV